MSGINKHFDLEWRVTGLHEFNGEIVEEEVDFEVDLEAGSDDEAPSVGERIRVAAVQGEQAAETFLGRAANNVKSFVRNRFNDTVAALRLARDLSVGFVAAVIDTVARIDYLTTKLLALVEAAALVVTAILPLAALGIIHKITGRGGEFASTAFAKARSIAENNIKLATVGMLASQTVSFLELATAAKYLAVVTSALPAVARVVVATAATIWHDKINRALQTVGSILGLTDAPAAAAKVSDEQHKENMAQFVGSGAALAAASAASTYGTGAVAAVGATALSGFVAPAALSALGANAAFYAYDKYRSMPSSNDAPPAAAAAAATVAVAAGTTAGQQQQPETTTPRAVMAS